MMRNLITVLLIFVNIGITLSQAPLFNFETYGTVDGLPQSTITAIHQDSYGFMWFGTQDGLVKYDGYIFKTFRHNFEAVNSISNNYIWDIQEDSLSNLWISSFGGGLTKLDLETETFQHYKSIPNDRNSLSHNNTFQSIRIDDHIWVVTDNGLCKLNPETGHVDRFLHDENATEGQASNYLGILSFQKPNLLWLSNDKSLIQFNTETFESQPFEFMPYEKDISLNHIRDIQTFGNKILIITSTHFLELNFGKNSLETLLHSNEVRGKPSFTTFLASKNGNYWIGSDNGLIFFNSNSKHTYLYQHDKNRRSVPNNNIYSFYRSQEGVLWIGTQGGLAKLENEHIVFKSLHVNENPNALTSNHIKGILEMKDSLLWIATTDGLNVLDQKSDMIYHFKNQVDSPTTISSDYILSLCLDTEEALWVGTKGGGLNKLIWNNEEPISSAYFRRHPILNASIQYIFDDDEFLWLGTNGQGLIRFNKKEENFIQYQMNIDGTGPNHTHIYHIYKDSYQNYWLGTATGGLNLFDPESERFFYIKKSDENPHSLVNDLVLCIFEDHNNQLWLGTAGGISKLSLPLKENMIEYFQNQEDNKNLKLFQNYGKQDGFVNDVIYGILEADNGHIWLSTNEGIVEFDPDHGVVIQTYTISDGLRGNEHNQNAFFKKQNGILYFGGMDGVTYFHPDSLQKNTILPQVQITDFRLFNERVPLMSYQGKEVFQLSKTPYATANIQVKHTQKVITFGFAALNYINTEENEYLYKLEGFDEDWLSAGRERMATYTNLDAGDYVFKVKASNNDGIWNEKGASINLTVLPPWWLSWWASTIYFVLLITIIYGFIDFRIQRVTLKLRQKAAIEKARVEERELFRLQSAGDFHDEAGNKITKIKLLTELAKRETSHLPQLQQYLAGIEKNSKDISTGMRDFIWTLDDSKDTLFDTAVRLKEFGEELFSLSNISFYVIGLVPEFTDIHITLAKRRATLQIFKEAMNNCIKYSKAKKVELIFKAKNTEVEIVLKDDGSGFDLQDKISSKGFGLKNMKYRAEKVNAKFSIKSKVDEGTEIKLDFEL